MPKKMVAAVNADIILRPEDDGFVHILQLEMLVALGEGGKMDSSICSREGNIVATRMDTNLQFYGDPYLTTVDLLLGTVDRPKAIEPLYAAHRDLHCKLQY